jgi:hypothetical protein
MANAYYTCNLTPVGLMAQAGYSPRWLGNHLEDVAAPARREALSIHPMTCPYVTQLVAAADALLSGSPAEDCLVVPGGCDAMRRMGDLLAASYSERVFVVSMPRSSADGAARTLAGDLRLLDEWLRVRLPEGAAHSETTEEPPPVGYPSAPAPGGAFIVAGPLSDGSLLRLVTGLGVGVAALESCTSPDRWKALAADTALGATAAGSAADDGDVYLALAARLLDIGMCPRRSTVDRKAHLNRRLVETRPSSVIYARQSFCDPGAYDALTVAELAEQRGLPYLEIEVGFPFEASGPLRTRVEAFLEAQLLDDDLLGDDLDDFDDPGLDDQSPDGLFDEEE